jgi:flagellar biosynthesis activator protein FlaF
MMTAMLNASNALQAYKTASRYRSQRDQEADVFRRATGALKGAREAGPVQQIRALTDNRRLWTTVGDLVRDPANALPEPLRAALLSIGITVQREMDQESPDFDFLIAINETIAAGLTGHPGP